MDVLILSDDPVAVPRWRRAFADVAPCVRVCRPGETSTTIIAAVVEGQSRGRLAGLSGLRVVFAATVGVDDLLLDETLPDVPLVRLAPPEAVGLMRDYIVYHVIHYRRRFDRHVASQRHRLWSEAPSPRDGHTCRISVLGLGKLGMASAVALRDMGYQVTGWSRRPRTVPGIQCESGPSGLTHVIRTADILVCLLPLTSETRNILDAKIFRQLPPGACLINAGRGACLRETDLLAALDDGTVAHAVLDVFETEPLPAASPFWTHPSVTVTPHIAADPSLRSLARHASDLLQTILTGGEPDGLIDRTNGY